VFSATAFGWRWFTSDGADRRTMSLIALAIVPVHAVAGVLFFLAKSGHAMVLFPAISIPIAVLYVLVRYDLYGSRARLARPLALFMIGFVVCVLGTIASVTAAQSLGVPFLSAFALCAIAAVGTTVATGLALTLFGLGLSALIGTGYLELRPPPVEGLRLGGALARLDVIVLLSLFLVAASWAALRFSRAGLILRAVGESHAAAHALGYKVIRVRMLAILFGGALAGIGGGYLSLMRVSQWTEGMTAGAGWIALALVVFASWKPAWVLVGAYLFGGILVLQLNLQAAGAAIPVEALSMSPYLITILVLVLMSSGRARAALNAPADLGKPFHASG
jgi:simple sugar transport system permease protein